MKAIVRHAYGRLEALELRDVETPSVDEDRILVRVHASSVNPLDWHEITGTPYLVRLQLGLRAPKCPIPGSDFAGEVEAVGRKVTGYAVGDRVFGMADGAFAEYVAVRPGQIAAIPPTITYEQAAAAPVAALTALQALRKADAAQARTVLVNGASGGVGTFAVQLAKWHGAEVTAVCSTANVDAARALGADHVVDYTREDFTRSGHRYDVIIDVAGTRSIRARLRALAPKGTLVMIGGPMKNRWVGPLFSLVRAMAVSALTRRRMIGILAENNAGDLAQLAALCESGAVAPHIERTYPLAEIPRALRVFEDGHARGKTVITVFPGGDVHSDG